MKDPTTQTIAERYEFLLSRLGSHEGVLKAANEELQRQERYESKDLIIKRNIAKIKEIINYK